MKHQIINIASAVLTGVLMLTSCSDDEGMPKWDDRYTVDNFPVYNVKEFKDGKKQERIIYELKDQPARIIKEFKHKDCPYYYVTWSDVEFRDDITFEEMFELNEKSFVITKEDFDRFNIPLDTESITISAYVTNLSRLCYPSLFDIEFWIPLNYMYHNPNKEIEHDTWIQTRVEIKAYVTDMKAR